MKGNPLRILAAGCLLVVAIFLVGMIASAMNKEGAQSRDFIAYWAAGQQLAHGSNPYDADAVLGIERAAGLSDSRPLVMRNPPPALFLALPLGLVSSNIGLTLWLLGLLASLMISIRLLWAMEGRPEGRLHMLGYVFAPVLACLMAGQIGIFLLLGMTLFLRFHISRPFVAGASLLLCAAKPHLFLPFAAVLVVWALKSKGYRLLAGAAVALGASSALTFAFDPSAWQQYTGMLASSGKFQREFIPTLSVLVRLLVAPGAAWPQTVITLAACCWALWYFWTRRATWDWMNQGLLVLLVSELFAPYAWFTDESVLLPALLVALYRSDRAGRSLLPFGIVLGVAALEVLFQVPLTSYYYLWTAPAWLALYLFAARTASGSEDQGDVMVPTS